MRHKYVLFLSCLLCLDFNLYASKDCGFDDNKSIRDELTATNSDDKNSGIESNNFVGFKNRLKKRRTQSHYKRNVDISKFTVEQSKNLSNIEINGLNMVSKETILNMIAIGKNNGLSEKEQISFSLKSLHKSGLFSNVSIEKKENGKFAVNVKENAIIEQVVFEGNENVKDDSLKTILSSNLMTGKMYNRFVIQEAVTNLQMAYKLNGYPSASIVPKVINLQGGKVNIVFEINEGKKTVVERIIFCGNKAFPSSFLKEKMFTKEHASWRFWNTEASIFGEDKIYINTDALKALYMDEGYPDINVKRIASEIDFSREKSYITVTLEEGFKFKFAAPNLTSEIDGIKVKDYKNLITIKDKEDYCHSMIEQNRRIILRELNKKGKTFVDVLVDVNLDRKNRLANVSYKIVEGKRLFIERIDIIGNTITADSVIRKYLNSHEGDPFNSFSLEMAVQDLKDTDYFEDVSVNLSEGSMPDRVNVTISVKEKVSCSAVNLAFTLSDADGLGGMLGYSNTNFRGRGQTLTSDIMVSQKTMSGSISLSEPNFIWKDVVGSIEIGGNMRNRKKEEHARYRDIYISPSIGYRINDNLSHTIVGTFTFGRKLYIDSNGKKLNKVNGNEASVSTIMIDEFGTYRCGELTSILSYSGRFNKLSKKSGYIVSLRNSYAGLIGNVSYFKNSISGEYYTPINFIDDKTMFSIKGQVGHISERKNVKSHFRYQFGGDGYSFRGFDTCGVSPREPNTDSIGGTKFWSVTTAVRHPISDSELGIIGAAFVDVGSVWGVPYKYAKNNPNRVQKNLKRSLGLDIVDSSSPRVSIGISIEWKNCPVGAPMTFTFAVPLKRAKFDKKKTFTLSGGMF